MAERIIDILITLGILGYLLIKYKNNVDWFFLLFVYIVLNICFVTVVILRSFGYKGER